MKKYSLLFLVFFCIIFLSRTSASDVHSDVHVVIETSRTYMDHTTKFTDEYWLTDDKIYQKRNNRVYITRKDLKLIWSIDSKEKTYSGRKIEDQSNLEKKKGSKSKQKEIQKADIHDLGFHYEPDYEWEIKETDETKDINGFPCRLFLAEGQADFAEIILKFWICTEIQLPGAAEYHGFLMEELEGDVEQEPVLETLKKYKNSFPVYQEQIIENAISPTLHYETCLITLEITDAPQSIYDLPQGIKKLGQNE